MISKRTGLSNGFLTSYKMVSKQTGISNGFLTNWVIKWFPNIQGIQNLWLLIPIWNQAFLTQGVDVCIRNTNTKAGMNKLVVET